MRLPVFLMAATAALALAGCGKADDDKAFGERVHTYLMAHPEVIREAVQKLQANDQAKAASESKTAIAQNRAAIERDPRDFVANPNGRVTVTEFYDYRCPHCINVAPGVLQLIAQDHDVRFVFKEMPIFGALSERAARGAMAVKQKGGDYLGVYKDFMNAKPLNDEAVDRVLKAHGIDPASIETPAAKQAGEAQISDVQSLANALGIEGTPAFVIGDTIIPGESMPLVKDAIAAQRSGGIKSSPTR